MMRSATAFDDDFARRHLHAVHRRGSSPSASPSSWRCRLVLPKPATSAAARARIASMAIVCRLFLIKEPPTSRLSKAIRRNLDTGSTVRSIRAADPRRRGARPGHDRRPAARERRCSRAARSARASSASSSSAPARSRSRGALNKISSLDDEESARGVIAISAGNHAQAVAFAAARSRHRRARRDVAGRVRAEDRGDPRLRRDGRPRGARPGGSVRAPDALIEETGRTLVHPFDDPLVIAGAGTVGLEIEEDAPDADAVIVPVGGGGLISGIQTAIGDRIRVIAVEPETEHGTAHRARARASRRWVEPTSIADGLNAPIAGALPLEICARPRAAPGHARTRSSTPSASSTSGPSSRASPPPRSPPRPG